MGRSIAGARSTPGPAPGWGSRILLAALACALGGTARAQPGAPPAPSPAGVPVPPEVAPAEVAPPPPVPTVPLSRAVELDPGATCLQLDTLLERVARWLRRETVDEGVRVHVRGGADDAQQVVFVIERAGVDGAVDRAERRIADAPVDCDQLHSALALSIALAIDANPGEGDAGTPLPDDEALLAGPPEPAYFALGAVALVHATSGLLTDVAPGLTLRGYVAFLPWLELRAGAFGSFVEDQSVPSRASMRIEGKFDAALLAGRLDACAVHGLDELRLSVCGGALLGNFGTQGRGFSAGSFVQNQRWVAAAGGVDLQAELGAGFALAAAVDLVIPFGDRSIQVVGPSLDVVGERSTSPLAVLVGVGPVFRFF